MLNRKSNSNNSMPPRRSLFFSDAGSFSSFSLPDVSEAGASPGPYTSTTLFLAGLLPSLFFSLTEFHAILAPPISIKTQLQRSHSEKQPNLIIHISAQSHRIHKFRSEVTRWIWFFCRPLARKSGGRRLPRMKLAENQGSTRRAPAEQVSCERTGSHMLARPLKNSFEEGVFKGSSTYGGEIAKWLANRHFSHVL
jgi:hypothetical protein